MLGWSRVCFFTFHLNSPERTALEFDQLSYLITIKIQEQEILLSISRRNLKNLAKADCVTETRHASQ